MNIWARTKEAIGLLQKRLGKYYYRLSVQAAGGEVDTVITLSRKGRILTHSKRLTAHTLASGVATGQMLEEFVEVIEWFLKIEGEIA